MAKSCLCRYAPRQFGGGRPELSGGAIHPV